MQELWFSAFITKKQKLNCFIHLSSQVVFIAQLDGGRRKLYIYPGGTKDQDLDSRGAWVCPEPELSSLLITRLNLSVFMDESVIKHLGTNETLFCIYL